MSHKIPKSLIAILTLATSSKSVSPLHAQAGFKCYGISKAGQNACNDLLGRYTCFGHSTEDYSPADWDITKNEEECKSKKGPTKEEAIQELKKQGLL